MYIKYGATFVAAFVVLLAMPFAHAEVINISSDELKALMQRGTPVVDLRTAGEWRQTGVVKGSQLITLFDEQGRADPVAWRQQTDKVAAASKPVILICRSGNRSDQAARYLDQIDHKRTIYNVKAGIATWIREGHAVVSLQDNLKQAGISCSPSC